jgi:hypothetical protein
MVYFIIKKTNGNIGNKIYTFILKAIILSTNSTVKMQVKAILALLSSSWYCSEEL